MNLSIKQKKKVENKNLNNQENTRIFASYTYSHADISQNPLKVEITEFLTIQEDKIVIWYEELCQLLKNDGATNFNQKYIKYYNPKYKGWIKFPKILEMFVDLDQPFELWILLMPEYPVQQQIQYHQSQNEQMSSNNMNYFNNLKLDEMQDNDSSYSYVAVLYSEPIDQENLIKFQYVQKIAKLFGDQVIVTLKNLTMENLQYIISDKKYKFFHLIVNGSFNGEEYYIDFEDDDNNTKRQVKTSELMKIFSQPQVMQPELVIVDSQLSKHVAEIFLKSGIRYALAIQNDFPQNNNQVFSFFSYFYDKLLAGYSIQQSYQISIDKLKDEDNFTCCCAHNHKTTCQWQATHFCNHQKHIPYCQCPQREQLLHKWNENDENKCQWAEQFIELMNLEIKFKALNYEDDDVYAGEICSDSENNKQVFVCCCPELHFSTKKEHYHGKKLKYQLLNSGNTKNSGFSRLFQLNNYNNSLKNQKHDKKNQSYKFQEQDLLFLQNQEQYYTIYGNLKLKQQLFEFLLEKNNMDISYKNKNLKKITYDEENVEGFVPLYVVIADEGQGKSTIINYIMNYLQRRYHNYTTFWIEFKRQDLQNYSKEQEQGNVNLTINQIMAKEYYDKKNQSLDLNGSQKQRVQTETFDLFENELIILKQTWENINFTSVAEKFDLIENNKQTQCIIFYDDVQFLEENDNSSNSQNRNELLTQLSYLEEKKNVKILMSLSTTENNQFDLEQVLVDCNFYRQYKNMPQFNAKDAKKLLIDNIEEQFLQVIRGQFDHILDEFIELLPKVPNQIIQQAKQFKNTNKLYHALHNIQRQFLSNNNFIDNLMRLKSRNIDQFQLLLLLSQFPNGLTSLDFQLIAKIQLIKVKSPQNSALWRILTGKDEHIMENNKDLDGFFNFISTKKIQKNERVLYQFKVNLPNQIEKNTFQYENEYEQTFNQKIIYIGHISNYFAQKIQELYYENFIDYSILSSGGITNIELNNLNYENGSGIYSSNLLSQSISQNLTSISGSGKFSSKKMVKQNTFQESQFFSQQALEVYNQQLEMTNSLEDFKQVLEQVPMLYLFERFWEENLKEIYSRKYIDFAIARNNQDFIQKLFLVIPSIFVFLNNNGKHQWTDSIFNFNLRYLNQYFNKLSASKPITIFDLYYIKTLFLQFRYTYDQYANIIDQQNDKWKDLEVILQQIRKFQDKILPLNSNQQFLQQSKEKEFLASIIQFELDFIQDSIKIQMKNQQHLQLCQNFDINQIMRQYFQRQYKQEHFKICPQLHFLFNKWAILQEMQRFQRYDQKKSSSALIQSLNQMQKVVHFLVQEKNKNNYYQYYRILITACILYTKIGKTLVQHFCDKDNEKDKGIFEKLITAKRYFDQIYQICLAEKNHLLEYNELYNKVNETIQMKTSKLFYFFEFNALRPKKEHETTTVLKNQVIQQNYFKEKIEYELNQLRRQTFNIFDRFTKKNLQNALEQGGILLNINHVYDDSAHMYFESDYIGEFEQTALKEFDSEFSKSEVRDFKLIILNTQVKYAREFQKLYKSRNKRTGQPNPVIIYFSYVDLKKKNKDYSTSPKISSTYNHILNYGKDLFIIKFITRLFKIDEQYLQTNQDYYHAFMKEFSETNEEIKKILSQKLIYDKGLFDIEYQNNEKKNIQLIEQNIGQGAIVNFNEKESTIENYDWKSLIQSFKNIEVDKQRERNNKESYIDLSQRSGPTNIMKSYLSRSFVARNADITNILRTFVNDKKKIDFKNSYNIINLYGKEGAGKTEFALQLGKKLRPIFNHGVYYFSLLELQLSIYQGDLHKLMEATFGNEFKNRKQGYFVENMCIILDDIDCYLNGQQVLNFKETIQEISEGKSTLILVSGSMLDDKEEQQNEDSGNTGGINSSRLNLKKKTKNRKVLVSLIKNARPKSEFFSYQIEELVDENFTAIKVLLTSLLDIHFKYKNDQQKEELQNKMRNELVSLGGNLKFVISKFLILLKTDNNGVDIQDEKEVDLYNKFNQNDQEFQKNLNLTKTDKILLSSCQQIYIFRKYIENTQHKHQIFDNNQLKLNSLSKDERFKTNNYSNSKYQKYQQSSKDSIKENNYTIQIENEEEVQEKQLQLNQYRNQVNYSKFSSRDTIEREKLFDSIGITKIVEKRFDPKSQENKQKNKKNLLQINLNDEFDDSDESDSYLSQKLGQNIQNSKEKNGINNNIKQRIQDSENIDNGNNIGNSQMNTQELKYRILNSNENDTLGCVKHDASVVLTYCQNPKSYLNIPGLPSMKELDYNCLNQENNNNINNIKKESSSIQVQKMRENLQTFETEGQNQSESIFLSSSNKEGNRQINDYLNRKAQKNNDNRNKQNQDKEQMQIFQENNLQKNSSILLISKSISQIKQEPSLLQIDCQDEKGEKVEENIGNQKEEKKKINNENENLNKYKKLSLQLQFDNDLSASYASGESYNVNDSQQDSDFEQERQEQDKLYENSQNQEKDKQNQYQQEQEQRQDKQLENQQEQELSQVNQNKGLNLDLCDLVGDPVGDEEYVEDDLDEQYQQELKTQNDQLQNSKQEQNIQQQKKELKLDIGLNFSDSKENQDGFFGVEEADEQDFYDDENEINEKEQNELINDQKNENEIQEKPQEIKHKQQEQNIQENKLFSDLSGEAEEEDYIDSKEDEEEQKNEKQNQYIKNNDIQQNIFDGIGVADEEEVEYIEQQENENNVSFNNDQE